MADDYPQLMKLVECVQASGTFAADISIVQELERLFVQYFSLEDEHSRLLENRNRNLAKHGGLSVDQADSLQAPNDERPPLLDACLQGDISIEEFVHSLMQPHHTTVAKLSSQLKARDLLVDDLRHEVVRLQALLADTQQAASTSALDESTWRNRVMQAIEERQSTEVALTNLEAKHSFLNLELENRVSESKKFAEQAEAERTALKENIQQLENQLIVWQAKHKAEVRRIICLRIKLAYMRNILEQYRSQESATLRAAVEANEKLSFELSQTQKEILRYQEQNMKQEAIEDPQLRLELVSSGAELKNAQDASMGGQDEASKEQLVTITLDNLVVPSTKRSTNMSMHLLKSADSAQKTLDSLRVDDRDGHIHPDYRKAGSLDLPWVKDGSATGEMKKDVAVANQGNASLGVRHSLGEDGKLLAPGAPCVVVSKHSDETRAQLADSIIEGFKAISAEPEQPVANKPRIVWLEEFTIYAEGLLGTNALVIDSYKNKWEEARNKVEVLETHVAKYKQLLQNSKDENNYVLESLLKRQGEYTELLDAYNKLKVATKTKNQGQGAEEGRPKANTSVKGFLANLNDMF